MFVRFRKTQSRVSLVEPAGETNDGVLRLDFDRRLMRQFCGSVVASEAGLLPYRELDDVLGLTVISGNSLADARTGKNGRHALVGLLRQSVFSRLAGYENVNDAGSLRHDPAKCAGLSAAKLLRGLQRRRARWAASRRSGSLRTRTLPIFRGNVITSIGTREWAQVRI
jgi:hypothetical protein